jgi:hypothetical protein
MTRWQITEASRKRIHAELKKLVVRANDFSSYGLWQEVVEICKEEGYDGRHRQTWDVATTIIRELGRDEYKDSGLRWLIGACFEGLAFEMRQQIDDRQVIQAGLRRAFEKPRGRDVVRQGKTDA